MSSITVQYLYKYELTGVPAPARIVLVGGGVLRQFSRADNKRFLCRERRQVQYLGGGAEAVIIM